MTADEKRRSVESELRRVRDYWTLAAISAVNREDCRRAACLEMARAASEGLRAYAETPMEDES